MEDEKQVQKKKPVAKLHGQEDDTEETYTYAYHKRYSGNLNEDKGVFDNDTFEGINTKLSVFDKTAVFRTDK